MENPKTVHRFLLTLLGAGTAVALGMSIYYRDFHFFLGWLAALALSFVACGLAALLNVVMFAPIFWLMGRFTSRGTRNRRRSAKEHGV